MSVEDKVLDLIESTVNSLGYDVWRVKYFSGKRNTLQVMIDKSDGTSVDVEGCADVSNIISPILDVEDVIKSEYDLEVSSPGLDRPLIRIYDFERFKGSKARIVLRLAQNNVRRFKGYIHEISGTSLVFRIGDGDLFSVDHSEIESANLILSEDL